MKEKIFDGIFCSKGSKCPYAIKIALHTGPWYCGYYNEILQSEDDSPLKILRCPSCIKASIFGAYSRSLQEQKYGK